MAQSKTPKYTTIIHKVRLELDLSCNEYCVADIIFSLSNNPDSKIQGWCWATRKKIGEFLGISARGITKIIERLVMKGMVEKDEETKYLKTTSLWYNSVVLERLKMRNTRTEQSSTSRNKVPMRTEQSSYGEDEQSSYNKNKDYNNNYKKNPSSFKKPFFRGEEMRKSRGKWWVLPKDGSPWLEFVGDETAIEYK